MKRKLFLIIALFVCSLDFIYAQSNVSSQEALRMLVGTWQGSYHTGTGEHGLTLIVYEERGNFKATFEFYNLPGRRNANNGKYYMNVSYNTRTRRYTLTGYEWIVRPRNYSFANLEGTLNGNVFSGSTFNFRVVRVEQTRNETTVQQINLNPQEALKQLVGTWEGSYHTWQGEHGLTLTVYNEEDTYKAIFDFYNLPGQNNGASGKYYMNVSYNQSNRRYSLNGYEWIIQPRDYGFANLEGTLTGDIFSGSTYNFSLVRIDEAEIAKREEEARQKEAEKVALFQTNLTTIFGSSRAEQILRSIAEVNIDIPNVDGTDARNDVAWRRNWVERLTKAEELFNNLFSNRGQPYTLFYSTGIQQGNINYQTETVQLSFPVNIRINDNWVNILDNSIPIIQNVYNGLLATGRAGTWGLEVRDSNTISLTERTYKPWVSQTANDPFNKNWQTDFSIIFELLNERNQVIGRQTVNLSPTFGIYRKESTNQIARGLIENSVENVIFNNVKVNDTSDRMTVRIVSINGANPANARIQITPMSESEWNETGWRKREETRYYLR